jgi:cobalt/nickel transport protein
MRKHLGTLGVVAAIIALFALAMILGTRQAPGEGEAFVGTDSAATTHIEASQPGYSPWFKPLFAPASGEVESGLFALQAALGGGLLGFVLGTLRERRRHRAAAADAAAASDAAAAPPEPRS